MADRAEDRELIERAVTLYSHLVDFGRFDEWGDLFTEDASASVHGGVQVWGDGPTVSVQHGRAEIVEFVRGNVEPLLEKGIHLMHMAGKPVVEIDGDTATAWWTYVVVSTTADAIGVAATGRYHCELVRCPDRQWRFTNRVCVETGGPLPEGALRQPPAH